MKPYYESPDSSIRVYHARCEDVIASVLPVSEIALVHADPPYGVDAAVTNKRRRPSKKALSAYAKDNGGWANIVGDSEPFEPAPLLALDRRLVLWGANNYASRLIDSGGWIVWDKKRGGTVSADYKTSDAELAWSNLSRMVSLFSFMWNGFMRDGELCDHLHPTQKPIALSTYVFGRAKLKRNDLVFVPYLGSGPDLPAARAMGLRVIACDVEQWCCDTAIGRLGAITPERASDMRGLPLFGGAR